MSKKITDQAVHMVLRQIGQLDKALDLLWLAEKSSHLLDDQYFPKLYGIKGGHEGYRLSKILETIVDALPELEARDLLTIEIVTRRLHSLMRPKLDESRGNVQLKTIKRQYPIIDWQETGKKNFPVYVLNEDGSRAMADFYFTYAYVRLYASKGDESRKSSKLLSIYADQGMGKGGSGGYVAAAFGRGLVTEDQILDAWHAGREDYNKFIGECADLLSKQSDGTDGSDETEID